MRSWRHFGGLWVTSGCPLDLHGVPGGSKVDFSWILGVVWVAVGHDFWSEIMLWAMTFPCMLSEWFLEAFCMDLWPSREAQNLNNYVNSMYSRQISRFDQRGYKMGTERFRDRFWSDFGVIWEAGGSSWTSLGHRFWTLETWEIGGRSPGGPKSRELVQWRVKS